MDNIQSINNNLIHQNLNGNNKYFVNGKIYAG